jgi:peptidoglycan/xylan/chitin deacetylase (PgdA/CDA1 family)
VKGIWRRDSDRRKWLIESAVGLVMLPLSIIPLWLYLTHTSDGYLLYLKGRYSIWPPATAQLSPPDRAIAIAQRRRQIHGVPVLAFHGIGPASLSAPGSDGRFVVARGRFAEQMRSLQAAGYRSITPIQLADYLRTSNPTLLPRKPILITFDDGRTDAMLQADKILKDTGMRATMFVIGATAERGGFYYEQADALSHFAGDGRWTLEAHTFDLHHVVATADGAAAALVYRKPGERIEQYRRRLAADIHQETRFLARFGAEAPIAFAYPFSNWGQEGDPRVERALRDELAAHYQLGFDQDQQSGWQFALPGDDSLHIHRLEVLDWTGPQLLHRLALAAKHTDTTYEERGLDVSYSPRTLVLAALHHPTCPGAGAPIRSRTVTGRQKLVAIGFDDGPSPYTAQILAQLQRYHAHATFFQIGEQIPGHERLLQRILVSGDEIGNHTWTHPHPGRLTNTELRQQLVRTNGAIHHALPTPVCLFRPPYGEDVPRISRIAATLGLTTVLWSIDPGDYALFSPREIAHRVLSRITSGAIVVLHDGGANRSPTVQALPLILASLERHHYRVVTITQLLARSLPQTTPSARHATPRE